MTRKMRIALGSAALIGASSLLSGCATGIENGALPSTRDVTNHTGTIIDLWNNSWIAALVVGVITWALMLWAVAAYRKRKDDNVLPVQTRANIPLELMYTAVPLIMIAVLFRWTATDTAEIKDISEPADVHIQVIGKQWAWDFNYLDDDVYSSGVQAELTGEEGVPETLPTLYLPVGERVEFQIDARDVIHSFWIIGFLYKQDMVPGRTTYYQVIPMKEGLYEGKCAELCGEYHSAMLFNVEVVSREEYDAQMEKLRDAGQTGQLGLDYSRQQDADVDLSLVEEED